MIAGKDTTGFIVLKVAFVGKLAIGILFTPKTLLAVAVVALIKDSILRKNGCTYRGAAKRCE